MVRLDVIVTGGVVISMDGSRRIIDDGAVAIIGIASSMLARAKRSAIGIAPRA